MSTTDDHNSEMNAHGLLDDAAAEAILAGRPVPDPDLGPVVGLVAEMRSIAREPAPAPSAQLAAILAGGSLGASRDAGAPIELRPDSAVLGRRAGRGRARPGAISRILRNAAAAGLAVRVALGAGVAAASMTGAAAAGVLPGPVQDAMADVVETVTPFELPRPTDRRPEPPAGVVPGDGVEAPGPVPAGPEEGLPDSGDPPLQSDPETSRPTITPSPSGGGAPASPASTPATTRTTGSGTTPTTASRTTPTTASRTTPTTAPGTTPGTAPAGQPDPRGAVADPAPPEATRTDPEAGSPEPGTTPGAIGTAPDTAAPDVGAGGISAPVPSGSDRP